MRELNGVVIRHGKRPKTVTVQVKFRAWHNNFLRFVYSSGVFHVHDEEEYSKTGDIVVIRHMAPINKKNYYVRNVVEEIGTQEYWEKIDASQHSEEVKGRAQQIASKMKREHNKKFHFRNYKSSERIEISKKMKREALSMAYKELRSNAEDSI